MRPVIHPRLVNPGPFEDPGLFIPFNFSGKALLFDLGDIHALSPRDILKISHIAVTHTHMDHFIGFDHFLRICLGRDKTVKMFGPPGILDNVKGKLAGYSWNLLDNYANNFELQVVEVRETESVTRVWSTQNRFSPGEMDVVRAFDGTLVDEPDFTLKAVFLDHGIPCLGLALEERYHINIMKARLDELGLEVGPWLREFKDALYRNDDWTTRFKAQLPDDGEMEFALDELAEKIAAITPGQKIVYVTDASGSKSNREKIISLAKGADNLFIEASFSNEDADLADAKRHLTAGMAGTLARKAGARQLTVFHFSPRYQDSPELLQNQAMRAFKNNYDSR